MLLPKITQTAPKSKRGARARYNAVMRAYTTMFDGGGMFGWDWPTLRSNWPEAYAYLQNLRVSYQNLAE